MGTPAELNSFVVLRATRDNATRARAEADLAQEHLRDEVRRLHADGVTQQRIADELGVSQPYVNRIIRSERARSGRAARQTPLDIARLYARGLLDRDETIHALVNFNYQDVPVPDDESIDMMPHTDSADLVAAFMKGLLDVEMYEEVLKSRPSRG